MQDAAPRGVLRKNVAFFHIFPNEHPCTRFTEGLWILIVIRFCLAVALATTALVSPNFVGASTPSETSPTVVMVGRTPTLSAFGRNREYVDIARIGAQVLGAVVSDYTTSSPKAWDSLTSAALSTTQSQIVLVWVTGVESAMESRQLPFAAWAQEATRKGHMVFVLPAEPDLGVAATWKLRGAVAELGLQWSELGAVAGGRPYDEALEEVRRSLKTHTAPVATPVARSPWPRTETSHAVEVEVVPTGANPTPVTAQGKALTAEFGTTGTIIRMPPPPALREYRPVRLVPRAPSDRKLPAVAD